MNRSKNSEPFAPIRVGVLFCGRQCPGGHNVITGLYDFLKQANEKSELIGFIGGTAGLFKKSYVTVTEEMLKLYRNQGGFDLLGRSADKIKDEEQDKAASACDELKLDGLVLIGGCYTNTDAAHLADYFVAIGIRTRVIGVPATITRDMKGKLVETTIGFDTACRIYSELIGNLCTDGNSAKKYYYFIRVMGRKTGHIALECALQTHPNLLLLGEETNRSHESLGSVVRRIADVVCNRYENGKKNFGVFVIPEGFIENIHELSTLIGEINELIADGVKDEDIANGLTPWSAALYRVLPTIVQKQLLKERESRGNIQLSQISSEKLFAELVRDELARRKEHGKYAGTFTPVTNYLGYKERCSLPSNFDCDLAYSCGRAAAALVGVGATGCLATVYNLTNEPKDWKVIGLPLSMIMNEKPDNQGRAYIAPSKIILHGEAYKEFKNNEKKWELDDDYTNPGPLQFKGEGSTKNTKSLYYEERNHLDRVLKLKEDITSVMNVIKPGVRQNVLCVVESNVESMKKVIDMINP